MLGWTIQFLLLTMLSAMWSAAAGEPEYGPARVASAMFGTLLVISLLCMIAGKAVRNSLR